MHIEYPEIGVCGLSCRLCPNYHIRSASRCEGCKSEGRMKVGCPFITCAVKKRGIEFCWECEEQGFCRRWRERRKQGMRRDSFLTYQKLGANIAFIGRKGISAFVKDQKTRERLLTAMLDEFNEGRSKSFYCIAAAVMEIRELKLAISKARNESDGMNIKERARTLRSILDEVAERRKYLLKLRK